MGPPAAGLGGWQGRGVCPSQLSGERGGDLRDEGIVFSSKERSGHLHFFVLLLGLGIDDDSVWN